MNIDYYGHYLCDIIKKESYIPLYIENSEKIDKNYSIHIKGKDIKSNLLYNYTE